MSLVMHAVQQALVSKCMGDAVLMDRITAVYDTVPQRSALPYVVVNELVQEALPALGEQLWRVTVVMEAWSDAQGRKTVLQILERLHGLLHYGHLNLEDASVREMRVEGASCVAAEQATRVVGSMEVQLLIATN